MTYCPKKYAKEYYGTKRGHLSAFLGHAKNRAKKRNLEFNLTLEYLESIATETCPIFNTTFLWGRIGGKRGPEGATLDRIIPELGYIIGNVVFISDKANRIKAEFTENELYKVADWLHDKRKEVLSVIQGQSPSVPTEHSSESKDNTESGTVHGAGSGEDCDGSHHHTGEPEGEDASDSPEASCRICLGSRERQMESSKIYERREDYGVSEAEARHIAKLLGCVCYQY